MGNIDPRKFLYGLRCARSVLSRPWANFPQYGPRARLARGKYLFCIISAQQFYITTLKMHIWFIAILLLGVSYYKSYLLICSLICNLLNGESPRNLHCCLSYYRYRYRYHYHYVSFNCFIWQWRRCRLWTTTYSWYSYVKAFCKKTECLVLFGTDGVCLQPKCKGVQLEKMSPAKHYNTLYLE